MNLKYGCLILLCMLVSPAWGQSSPQPGAGQAPPAWLESINPENYMLLAANLSPPFRLEGVISSRAEAIELSLETDKGAAVQKVHTFSTREKIVINQEGCPTTSIDIDVEVFETPEMVASARPIPKGAKKDEKDWWDPSAFRDSRLEGEAGEANARFSNVQWLIFVDSVGKWQEGPALQELQIRYKNIVARFCPTMYTGASSTGFGDYSPGDTCGLTAELARRWPDKVTGVKSPELVDLQLDGNKIFLSYYDENNFIPLEEEADRQSVAVWVGNKGNVTAENVNLQLYLQAPGDQDYRPLGDTILIGEIPPGKNASGNAIWDLGGQNVEGASLLAQAYIPGENDSHPDDNSAAILVNIYYANNGDRAFRPGKDGYSFGNYNFSGRETEELIEGFLATLVGNLQPEQIDQIAQAIEIRKTLAATAGAALGSGGGLKAEQALVERIVFAPTYVLMDDYLNRSMRAGAGGHCYGMSATSALYFEDPGQKPVEKDVGEMSLEEASQNIDIYVRAWFLPLFAALQSDMIVPRLNMGAQQCHQALKSSLQQDRKALIVEVFGSDGGKKAGHVVLGYKMIEVEGRPSVVYVYDPNYPAARIKPPLPMSQIYLWLQENDWGNPPYMGYQWTDRRITADRVHREVSLEDANAILPGLKKSITDLSSVLHSLGKALIVVRCPAEAVFTDPSGKSTGNQSGQLINAIEGAEVLSMGEVEIYRLPLGGRYEVAISGTGSGTLGFDVIAPENQTGLGLVSFQEIALSKGSSITGTLEAGDIDVLKTSSGDVLPSLEGYVDAGVSQPPQQIEAGADNGSESLAGNISSPAGDAVEKSIQDLQNPNVSIRREAAAALFDPKSLTENKIHKFYNVERRPYSHG